MRERSRAWRERREVREEGLWGERGRENPGERMTGAGGEKIIERGIPCH